MIPSADSVHAANPRYCPQFHACHRIIREKPLRVLHRAVRLCVHSRCRCTLNSLGHADGSRQTDRHAVRQHSHTTHLLKQPVLCYHKPTYCGRRKAAAFYQVIYFAIRLQVLHRLYSAEVFRRCARFALMAATSSNAEAINRNISSKESKPGFSPKQLLTIERLSFSGSTQQNSMAYSEKHPA